MENKLRERRYALILAGGRSRRMGSNKALLRLEERTETLLERAVRFWRESGAAERIFVAAGQPGYLPDLPEGAEPVYDLMEDGGPMAGLLSAFRRTDAGLFYLSAVDMPYLCREAIPPVPPAECDASVYLLNGRPEPLFGIYRRSVADAAERLLFSGKGKMSLLLDAVHTEYLPVPEGMTHIFLNLNTREDFLRAAEQDNEIYLTREKERT